MRDLGRDLLEIVTKIRDDLPNRYVPPSEGTLPRSQSVLPHAMVKSTRGYIERVVFQINGSYENGWFDACAVMMRRLLETLIIEVFEHFKIDSKIKNAAGDFLYLSDLISALLTESSWNLGRNTKQALPKLKDIGDQSAHSRRFIAHREDVDKLLPDFRAVVQELLFLSKLR